MVEHKSTSVFDTTEVHQFLGADGEPLHGTVIDTDGSISHIKNCILRFNNGYLVGGAQPAVEGTGHIEYWKDGTLHREDGLPAVSSHGFSVHEIWEHGERLK